MDRSPQEPGGSGHGSNGRPTNGPPTNTAGLAGMGIQFLAVILLFLFLGKWLDGRLGTTPWLLILGVFCGAGVSMFTMYRKVFAAEKPKPPVGPGQGAP